jgi:hypothetical protein
MRKNDVVAKTITYLSPENNYTQGAPNNGLPKQKCSNLAVFQNISLKHS